MNDPNIELSEGFTVDTYCARAGLFFIATESKTCERCSLFPANTAL